LRGDEEIESPCRRCGNDLSLLRRVERQAERAQGEARQALKIGELKRALKAALRARTLVRSPETKQTLSVVIQLLKERYDSPSPR